jgi:hypothetical protein
MYRANSNDTVGAVASPSPVTLAASSGSQSVIVTFATSDGAPATSLAVSTNLAALPAGWSWSGGPSGFSCPTVSGGTPCQLTLTFTPLSTESGTLLISYGYTNNAGTPQTGSVSISYDAT